MIEQPEIDAPSRSVPPQAPAPPLPVARSPRVDRLEAAVAAGRSEAIEAFWAEVATSGAPLVERDGDGQSIVTFLWRSAEDADVVLVANKVTDPTVVDAAALRRVPGTDVWALSLRMADTWRASYSFGVVGAQDRHAPLQAETRRMLERAVEVGNPCPPEQLERWWRAVERATPDPLNPHRLRSSSVVSLPAAPAQPWITRRAEVEAGTLSRHELRSEALGNTREVFVHEPARSSAGARDLLVVLDGEAAVLDDQLPPTLDNLQHDGRIPPMLTVMVGSISPDTRERELTCRPRFLEFLSRELIEWITARWHVTDDPGRTIIAGSSLGGLTAAYAGIAAPWRFGNAVSHSGSFWWPNPGAGGSGAEWLTGEVLRTPPGPTRFYLNVGAREWVLVEPVRRFHAALRSRGYDAELREFDGGHDPACWRGEYAVALEHLTNRWEPR